MNKCLTMPTTPVRSPLVLYGKATVPFNDRLNESMAVNVSAMADIAHCCANNLRKTAIFRHCNVPCSHCCPNKLRKSRVSSHNNALLLHMVRMWCAKVCTMCTSSALCTYRVVNIMPQCTSLTHHELHGGTVGAQSV